MAGSVILCRRGALSAPRRYRCRGGCRLNGVVVVAVVVLAVASMSMSAWGEMLWYEGFESPPGEAGAGYTASLLYSDGFGDYFTRTNGADGLTNKTYADWEGDWYWTGQDVDADVGSGGNGLNPQEIAFEPVDISGRAMVYVSALFAALQDTTQEGNGAIDAEDQLTVEYRIDAGGWMPLARFASDAPQRGFFALDPDQSGTAEGPRLTSTFTRYTWAVPHAGSGSTLGLRFRAWADSANEDFGLDGVAVHTTHTFAIPEPAAWVVIGGLGVMGWLRVGRAARGK